MILKMVVLGLTAALLLPISAMAQQTCQTIMLSACQIDFTRGSLDHFQNLSPNVSAAKNGPGKITLYCPLTNNAGVEQFNSDAPDHWGHLSLIANDPDGVGSDHSVSVDVLAYSRSGGGMKNVVRLLTSMDSSTPVGTWQKYIKNIDNHEFDFAGWDYLILVAIQDQKSPDHASARSVQFCPGKI